MKSKHMGTRQSGWGIAFCGAWLMVALPGCFVEAGSDAPPPPPPPSVGQLTLRWTVDETVDGNVCIMGQAAAIDIVLTTTDEQPAGEYQAGCSDFSTNVSALPPGGYFGAAHLIDGAGRARTTTLQINPFSIVSGTRLVIDIDFPASSFL
jgi:hypothetical protein